MMNSEPTLTRIQKARKRISAKCEHNPSKLLKYYIELQKQYQDRLIIEPKPTPIELTH